MFIVIVPAAPTSIARLPPSRSASRPLMIWPHAYASNDVVMIVPMFAFEKPNSWLIALLAMERL